MDPKTFEADIELARAVDTGSDVAWNQFVARYAPLLLSVIRRRHSRDEDFVRDVFADLLVELRRGALGKYEGRSALSTWLVVIAERRTLDHLRKKLGRRELPETIQRLSEVDQEVFRQFFWSGRGLVGTREALLAKGHSLNALELTESLDRIESELDPRSVRRLAQDLAGIRHVPMEEIETEIESLGGPSTSPPDAWIDEQAAKAKLEELRRAVGELSEEEQSVLRLRYQEQQPADAVAQELSLGDTRKVYTIAERAIRHLRRKLGGGQ